MRAHRPFRRPFGVGSLVIASARRARRPRATATACLARVVGGAIDPARSASLILI